MLLLKIIFINIASHVTHPKYHLPLCSKYFTPTVSSLSCIARTNYRETVLTHHYHLLLRSWRSIYKYLYRLHTVSLRFIHLWSVYFPEFCRKYCLIRHDVDDFISCQPQSQNCIDLFDRIDSLAILSHVPNSL